MDGVASRAARSDGLRGGESGGYGFAAKSRWAWGRIMTPNQNPENRDLDALRRAQRAHEPSMEEILASIRSIISDDMESAAGIKPAQGPQIAYAKAIGVEPEAVGEAAAPKIVWSQSEPAVEAAAEWRSEMERPSIDEPLTSSQTDAAVSASFEQLSASLALQSRQKFEEMARDMLRPMLKSWLDDHMPAIVERLVRAEIQRVARGGR